MPKRKKKTGKKRTVKSAAPRKKGARKGAGPRKKGARKGAGPKRRTAARKAAGRKKQVKKSPSKIKRKATRKSMRKVVSITRKQTTPLRVRTAKETFKPYRPRQGEEYMGAEQAAHFRSILLNWKKELMEEVDRTVHHMRDEASNFPDPNDRATQEEEFALELRTRDRERKLIKKIDESLIALEKGDYGYCEICGVEIGIRRLEARPTATLCIDCKTLDEIKERHLG